MLKKLLKYDFREVGRFWWIIATVTLSMSLAGSFVLRFLTENYENENLSIFFLLGTLFLIACVICIAGSMIVTYVLVFWRYYQHLFSDEGYLTFTLPVKRRDILLSKTLNAVLWISLHTIVLLICVAIVLIVGIPSDNGEILNFSVFEGIGEIFSMISGEIGWWIPLFLIEGLLLAVISAFFTTCLAQLCITIASIVAKKAKIVAAIGIYYLATMLISGVTQVGGSFIAIFLGSGIEAIFANASTDQICGVIALAVLIFTVMMSAFTLTVHFVTQGILERKLNLS